MSILILIKREIFNKKISQLSYFFNSLFLRTLIVFQKGDNMGYAVHIVIFVSIIYLLSNGFFSLKPIVFL